MEKIRYMKLKNEGGFVARMKILWEGSDGKGNIGHGEYEEDSYHDICIHAERSIDLSETNIPDNSEVQLKAVVVLGKDKTADEKFIYSKDSCEKATYEISGTTLINKLKKI